MKKHMPLVCGLVLFGMLAGSLFVELAADASTRPELIAKSNHIGDKIVVVTCLNGADPTGLKVAPNALLVSCGK